MTTYNTQCQVGSGVTRAADCRVYVRQRGDPIYRPLRVFAIDPAISRLDGSVEVVKVPYEPLQAGPVGTLFEVDNFNGHTQEHYRRANLDDPKLLMQNGHTPTPSNPEFHQQMVYAVCSLTYATFKDALGRDIAWGFSRTNSHTNNDAGVRLRLRPHAFNGRNAYYDPNKGEICFGYYQADEEVAGRNLPRGFVFTCLSQDIVTHEMTHALLDGLRAHFITPSGADVLAFHEAFADLVACFHHFDYEKVVLTALRRARGNIEDSSLLTNFAQQFGQTIGVKHALRTLIDASREGEIPKQYANVGNQPHERGTVLARAVIEAFCTVFKRKIASDLRLASNGTGILPSGELPVELQQRLVEQAVRLAKQFLAMCIRAIDYCPPVNLEFGDYLRAVITADTDLIPEDPWGYREAWIDAFGRRGIYPRGVVSLSEDALLWQPPDRPIPQIRGLNFAAIQFKGDPGHPADVRELKRQAYILGEVVAQPENLNTFGCTQNGDPRLGGDTVEPPVIESIRTLHRVGPDGQLIFNLIAELTQCRHAHQQHVRFDFYGGSTVLIDPEGTVRYVIRKSVFDNERLERQQAFISSGAGQHFWQDTQGVYQPHAKIFQQLDQYQ